MALNLQSFFYPFQPDLLQLALKKISFQVAPVEFHLNQLIADLNVMRQMGQVTDFTISYGQGGIATVSVEFAPEPVLEPVDNVGQGTEEVELE